MEPDEIPAWAKLEEDEVPVGFLSDSQGTGLLEMLLVEAAAPMTYEALLRTYTNTNFSFEDSPDRHCPWDFLQWFAPTTPSTNFESSAGPVLTALKQHKRHAFPRQARTYTMYKNAAKKMKPVDSDFSDGSVPAGSLQWKTDRESKARERMV